MKIATYNILKGGSQRVHWTKMIEGEGVDLLLVQESYDPHKHLPPLLYPTGRSQTVWEAVGNNGWGSAVFSRTGSVKPIPIPGFEGWVVGAEISGASWQAGFSDPLLVFSVHAPSRKQSYQAEVNNLLDEIREISRGREIVIGGDFNLSVSKSPCSERPVSKCDLEIQARLAELGLINCWQESNLDQVPHQTLRWTRNPTTPYHCDGIFVPQSWKDRLVKCTVLAGEEWNRLSDHNPVMAEFE